jgi:signal peptidase I
MRRRRIVAAVVGMGVVVATVLRGMTRRFAIREASMSPALDDGDWVIARRLSGVPERGAVVVFDDPTGSGMHLVKRVIGLPGEHVGIEGGRVTIDGALLADRWASGITGPDGSWDVPAGSVWLLGDNRALSVSDGRVLGPTPLDEIDWLVVARYWPTDRAGMIA